jgi:hypothetical protein
MNKRALMDHHDLAHEMTHDSHEEMKNEEDPDVPKKPFRLSLSQLHCYKVTDGFSKVVYARVEPKHFPEVRRLVDEKKMTLKGIGKVFKSAAFITMNIQVLEKPSEIEKQQ